MGWKSRGLVAARVLLVGATACSQGSGRPPDLEGEIDITLSNDPAVCDPLGGERCLLPFPNDYFTVADRLTATGRRVDLDQAATPANASGGPPPPAAGENWARRPPQPTRPASTSTRPS